MRNFTRRSILQGSASLAAVGGLASAGLLDFARAWAAMSPFKPEDGASLSLMRWKRFVQSEEDAFVALVDAFTQATGVKVEVSSESLDDVQPKASVAANTGSGPDLIWGLYSLPHLFPDKVIDLGDVAKYLGDKYGGWAETAKTYGMEGDKWVGIVLGYNANVMNYSQSALKKVGFDKFPETTDDFLAMAKATNDAGKPGGMALGHASGDGNAWVHWCLWAHGGNLVDANDKVIINSPETAAALEYGKQLYEVMIPGTASWNDSFNNKAFLSGQISWTNNGVSIYAAAKRDSMAEIVEDMNHANWPIGPVGKPTEFHIAYPIMVMDYTKVPNASKAFIAFMLEAENYNKWLEGAVGYITHPLNAYDSNPVWTSDPKLTVARDAGKRTLTAGHLGSVGEKAAAALADFIVLDMFANVATGRESVEGAMKMAERQASRLYR